MNFDDIRRQLSDARPAIIGGSIVAVMLLGTTVMIYFWRGTSFNVLMRDPVTTYVDAPVYLGAISNIGVMMWAATAAICLFTAWTIWRAGAERGDVRFLGWSGIGTLYLGLDDVMLLHERIIWRLTGLSEEVIIAVYIIAFIVYLVRFHAAILRAEYVLLGIALFFLGLSVAQDILMPSDDHIQNFFEDAAKSFGIIFWLIFYVRTSATAMRLQHQGSVATNARTETGGWLPERNRQRPWPNTRVNGSAGPYAAVRPFLAGPEKSTAPYYVRCRAVSTKSKKFGVCQQKFPGGYGQLDLLAQAPLVHAILTLGIHG